MESCDWCARVYHEFTPECYNLSSRLNAQSARTGRLAQWISFSSNESYTGGFDNPLYHLRVSSLWGSIRVVVDAEIFYTKSSGQEELRC